MKRITTVFTISVAIIVAMITAGFKPATLVYANKADTSTVSVVFTHDMHSHLEKFPMLKTSFDKINEKYPNSFFLDAGDFSMGTPYQTIFSSKASEIKMMDYIGFDATTFGNHEFDYRATGLASMLQEAAGLDVEIVAGNIDWKATLADDALKADGKKLKQACESYGVKEYTVIEKGDIKAAVFGLMGETAVEYAPESGTIFKDATESAKEIVAKIEKNEDVDIIICLSHCGTVENEEDVLEETEDYLIAEEVPEIDLIVSGHSHTELETPVVVGDTYIVSCGSYNAYMGNIVLEKSKDEGFKMKSYSLIPLNDKVNPDSSVEQELIKYRGMADEEYFNLFGYSIDQVIAKNTMDFPPIEKVGILQGEEPLGNLITDSYKYALRQAGTDADIAVVPLGVIRGSFEKGDITVADAFNVSSLGYGKDGLSGYPLVKAYLTGKELKAVAEVDASISNFMGVARLYSSGLEYSWNPNRLILNRAVDVKFNDGKSVEKIENDKMYSVVTDLYSCQMLGAVKDQSFGLLKIEPKDENGNVIENYEEHIVYDGDKEIKAWYALASYIDSFEGDVVSEYYGTTHGRKTEIDSKSPSELLKQPNKIMAIVVAVVVLLVVIVILIVRLIKRIVRKRAE